LEKGLYNSDKTDKVTHKFIEFKEANMSRPAEGLYDEKQSFTYEDYAAWPDTPRYELIEGDAVKLETPSQAHQAMLIELGTQFANFLRGKKCKVFLTPFDVRLNHKTLDNTVVQPDLLVVCDKDKLNGRHCLGAPDMVAEIISPSTVRKDKIRKFNLYQQAGVTEFWILDPTSRVVTVHILQDGRYTTTYYSDTDTINVHVLEDCEITLSDVFEDAPPPEPEKAFPPELLLSDHA